MSHSSTIVVILACAWVCRFCSSKTHKRRPLAMDRGIWRGYGSIEGKSCTLITYKASYESVNECIFSGVSSSSPSLALHGPLKLDIVRDLIASESSHSFQKLSSRIRFDGMYCSRWE